MKVFIKYFVAFMLIIFNVIVDSSNVIEVPKESPSSISQTINSNGDNKNADLLFKTNESEAAEIMEQANIRMKNHYEKMREIFLSSNQKYSQINTGPLIQEATNEYREFVNDLANNVSTFQIRSFKDDGLKRKIKLLSKLQLEGLPKDKYEKAMNLLRVMKQFATTKNVCTFDVEICSDKDRVAYLPKINEVIQLTKHPEKLLYYWREWRDDIGTNARNYFLKYVELFKEAALINGHITPSKTWYMYYEDDNFLQELENAISQLSPLYKEFHAYIRNALQMKYPDTKIKSDKPIPQHLMEQVIQHAWRAQSVFTVPFPKIHLPNVKIKMDLLKFTPLTINEMSARFYNSLGMKDLPQTFWEKYSRKISDDDVQPDCKAEIYYFPPEIAMKFCPKVDYKKFLQMHGHMAELHYNYRRGNLTTGLNREACPGFGSAIGEAAIISAGSPRHLEKIQLMENYTLNDELAMNRLFRMGVHTILTLPSYYVNEKFWVDALNSKIKPEKLNCEFWNMQEKYAGVSSPIVRTNSDFDPSYRFYSGIDPAKSNTIKIISELLGYQFYRALCIESGHYVPGDPKYPLHNCDFSDSNKTGKFIEEMMSLGSTKNWRDIMEILTGEREINANAILEYYYPLYIWLKDKNEKNEIEVGWEETDLCDEDS